MEGSMNKAIIATVLMVVTLIGLIVVLSIRRVATVRQEAMQTEPASAIVVDDYDYSREVIDHTLVIVMFKGHEYLIYNGMIHSESCPHSEH